MRLPEIWDAYFRPIKDPSLLPKGKTLAGMVLVTTLISTALVLYGYSAVVPISNFSQATVPFLAGALAWTCAAIILLFTFCQIYGFFIVKRRFRNDSVNDKNTIIGN
jgi:hypothetical protein